MDVNRTQSGEPIPASLSDPQAELTTQLSQVAFEVHAIRNTQNELKTEVTQIRQELSAINSKFSRILNMLDSVIETDRSFGESICSVRIGGNVNAIL